MPTPVPLKILSRRQQSRRLLGVLFLATLVGVGARALRPVLSVGSVHYEALAAIVVLSLACLALLLQLRRIVYRRAAVVFLLEGTALWICFGLGWVIVGRRLWGDLLAVVLMFWSFTVPPGLLLLLIIQRVWPPRLSTSCPQCEYDLTGLTNDRCPECGNGFVVNCALCGCRRADMTRVPCPDCSVTPAPETLVVTKAM